MSYTHLSNVIPEKSNTKEIQKKRLFYRKKKETSRDIPWLAGKFRKRPVGNVMLTISVDYSWVVTVAHYEL